MTKTIIKTRLDKLEAASPEHDHEWTIKIAADEHDQIKTTQYKDGEPVSLAQWQREHKPKPGEAIHVKIAH